MVDQAFKEWVSRVPQKQRGLYLKALQGKLTSRAAIKAKCYDCCAWERNDGGVDRIGDCTVRHCPLWPLRPFQKRKAVSVRSEAQVVSDEV